jgi:acetyltransferase-like isoleucine patch superfamily enzyme
MLGHPEGGNGRARRLRVVHRALRGLRPPPGFLTLAALTRMLLVRCWGQSTRDHIAACIYLRTSSQRPLPGGQPQAVRWQSQVPRGCHLAPPRMTITPALATCEVRACRATGHGVQVGWSWPAGSDSSSNPKQRALGRAMVIRRLMSRLAGMTRGRAYVVDPRISTLDLLAALWARAQALFRGFWQGLWLRSSAGMLFVGQCVVLRHRHALSTGRGVAIEDYVLIDALSRNGVTLGDGVTIQSHASIRVTGTLRELGEGLTVGSRSSIGSHSFVGAAGGVRIGDNVLIGQRVGIHAENHIWSDPTVPIRDQGVTRRGILIEDDCWLGSGCTILDGVTIGKGTVVAAGAVVTHSTAPYSVVTGVPARQTAIRSAPISGEGYPY